MYPLTFEVLANKIIKKKILILFVHNYPALVATSQMCFKIRKHKETNIPNVEKIRYTSIIMFNIFHNIASQQISLNPRI